MPGYLWLFLAGLSFWVALLSVGFLKRYAQNYLLDIPNERSSHSQPTPRGGGLGFILAFALTAAIAQTFSNPSQGLVWLPLIPLVAMGAIEDWHSLRADLRYTVHLLVSALVVIQCGTFPFPGLSSIGSAGDILATLLTIIGMTALINFYNFMDGLDGLVASVSALQLGVLALWFNQPVLGLLVAALWGFLYWNWSPAKIFMGDVGSTFLGGAVAIAFLSSDSQLASSGAALALLLPLIGDAVYTLSRRLQRGENIFQSHRTHLYQRLQQGGWSHAQVTLMYLVLTLLAAIGVQAWGLWGAGISLVGAIAAIVAAEWYLNFHPLVIDP